MGCLVAIVLLWVVIAGLILLRDRPVEEPQYDGKGSN